MKNFILAATTASVLLQPTLLAAAGNSALDTATAAPSSSAEFGKSGARWLDANRRFGFGFGAGYGMATGNAGKLYSDSRAPAINARASYWLDPRLAIQLSVQNLKRGYDVAPDGPTNVNLFAALAQAKYYFDVPLRPHLILGTGMYWRTDNIGQATGNDLSNPAFTQNAMGFNFGAGVEFQLEPSRLSLQLEGTWHAVSFADDLDRKFTDAGIPDRTGLWAVAQASFVYVW
jgi:opacity protein-like surface antigen